MPVSLALVGATLAARVVARIVDTGVALGVPEAELAGIVGRPLAELSEDRRVPIERAFECFAHCLRRTGDSAFPIRVAQSVTLEDYSVLGFALMTSPDAKTVLDRLVRYGDMESDSGTWRARFSAHRVRLGWVRSGRRTLGHRAANECALAELVGGFRKGIAGFAPDRVYFRHAAPQDTRAHETHFRAPIVWDSSFEGVDLPAAVLTARLTLDRSAVSPYFDRVLESRSRREASWTDRVRAALVEGLSTGPLAAAKVARYLGVSERSLRRALAEEHTTYRKILDDLRRDAASELIQSKKSVTEAAFLLGFSETSALSRAFRRWHGTSTRAHVRPRKRR